MGDLDPAEAKRGAAPAERLAVWLLRATRWPWPHRLGFAATLAQLTVLISVHVGTIVLGVTAPETMGELGRTPAAQRVYGLLGYRLISEPYLYVIWLGLCWVGAGRAADPRSFTPADRFAWFDAIVDSSLGSAWREPARVLASLAVAVLLLDLAWQGLDWFGVALFREPELAPYLLTWPTVLGLLFVALPWLILVYVDIVRAAVRSRRGPAAT